MPASLLEWRGYQVASHHLIAWCRAQWHGKRDHRQMASQANWRLIPADFADDLTIYHESYIIYIYISTMCVWYVYVCLLCVWVICVRMYTFDILEMNLKWNLPLEPLDGMKVERVALQDIYVDSIRVWRYESWSSMSILVIERPCLRLGSSHRLRYSQAHDGLWYCIWDHMRVLHSCVN